MSTPIPILTAQQISARHGYHQVIIYARTVGEAGLEHVTTYGVDKTHCAAAARIGEAIGRQVVEPLEEAKARADAARNAIAIALPLLERDRNTFLECHSIHDDIASLDADELGYLDEYDFAIRALKEAAS